MSVVDQARRWVGTVETGDNVVAGITDRCGINGQPWCAAAVTVWAADAGTPIPDGVGYSCPIWTRYAVEHGQAVPVTEGQPGDIILMEWPWQYPWQTEGGLPVVRGSGTSWDGSVAGSHVGVITSTFDGVGYNTIEGNTSGNATGSQDNGGGVWEKHRPLNVVCCIWRPPGLIDDSFAPAGYATQRGPAIGGPSYQAAPSGTVVWGVDVSEFQSAIDWAALRSAGVAYASIRVGDGSYVDPAAAAHYAGARAAGVLVGGYWFCRDQEDPAAQAGRWIERCDQIGEWDLPLCPDYEQASMSAGAPNAGWLAAAVLACAGRWPGRRIPVYSGWYMLRDMGAQPAIVDRAVIWIPGGPNYGTDSPHTAAPDVPWDGPPGWTCHAQQWTSCGWVGSQGRFDLDVITPAALDSMLLAGWSNQSAPIAATAAGDDMSILIQLNAPGDPQHGQIFVTDGLFKRPIATEDEMNELVRSGAVRKQPDGSAFASWSMDRVAPLTTIGEWSIAGIPAATATAVGTAVSASVNAQVNAAVQAALADVPQRIVHSLFSTLQANLKP